MATCYDGTTGWDKNFIGTGLRTVTGPALLDLERESQFLAPLRLADGCVPLALDDGADPVVTCAMADGRTTRFHFDRISGLLAQRDVDNADGRAPGALNTKITGPLMACGSRFASGMERRGQV